jgi:hypothetical protein
MTSLTYKVNINNDNTTHTQYLSMKQLKIGTAVEYAWRCARQQRQSDLQSVGSKVHLGKIVNSQLVVRITTKIRVRKTTSVFSRTQSLQVHQINIVTEVFFPTRNWPSNVTKRDL